MPSVVVVTVPCARLSVTHRGVFVVRHMGPVAVPAHFVVHSALAWVSCKLGVAS